MTTRTRALVPVLAAVLLAGGLAGCTSDFLVGGGETEATSTPTPSPSPTDAAPTSGPGQAEGELTPECDDILIDRPGNYVLGDCGTVMLVGSGIDLQFSRIDELVVRGDGARIAGDVILRLDLEGDRATVQATSLGAVTIDGGDNTVTAQDDISSLVIDGNDNTVTAPGGYHTTPVDNGLLNEIS